MEKREDAVDDAVFLKQCLPCKRTEQKIHPHRENEDQHNKAGLIDIPVCQNHGKRIGKQKTERGAKKRQPQRQAECLDIFLRRNVGEIRKGKAAFFPGERIVENQDQRNDDETGSPDGIRCCQPFL